MFVNRGAMHGPWLPIYGGGVALIVLVLKRLRKNVLTEILGIIILCGFVEYFTSFFMELATGLRWWDYTGYFLNLNGRVCLEGLMLFGIAGVTMTYLAAPILDNLFAKISMHRRRGICAVLITVFAIDCIWSVGHPNMGNGITEGFY